MIVSLIDQNGEKINNDHDEKFDLLCPCQQCDEIIQTGYSALLQLAAVAYTTQTHSGREESTSVEVFL